MPDGADWQLAIDIHPEDWRFPAGRSWVAGWVVSRSGRAVADVRAWIDDRPFLGLCGLPRPDVERTHLGHDGPPHAGFSFLLEPHRGARQLRVEIWDGGARWEEIVRQDISAAPDAADPTPPAALGAQIEPLLLRMLRARRANPEASWAILAGEALAAHRAAPLDTLPNPPFFGALEEPTDTGRVKYGRLNVTGWLAHRDRTITRLTAFAEPLQPVLLLHGLPRRDVGGVFAGLRNVGTAQFVGQVDLPAGLPSPFALRIFAETDDGRRELVFNRRFWPRLLAGAEAPLPPCSAATFLAAATALHWSARRAGLPGGRWADRIAALRGAWTAYRDGAPPRRSAAAPRPRAWRAASVRRPLEVIVVSHNLSLEGAPLFAGEYARHLAAECGWRVRVVSPQDGPLRPAFAQAGLPVDLVDARAAWEARTRAQFEQAVAALAAGSAWERADLIVANTLMAFWAVHVARHRRTPALFYIHESAPVRRFFRPLAAAAVGDAAEAALRQADRAVFIAAATEAVHARQERRGNFELLPSWIDLAGIDRFAANQNRRALRRRHGIGDDAVVFLNLGTVCERKGQHVFIRAAELLHRDLASGGPRPALRFLMVGARPGEYLHALRQDVALRGLAGVEFIDETPAAYEFYRLADVFVCSSFEESFPRVLMEAAGFGLPIVTTEVDGVRELLGPDEAWLAPPGDAARLADAMGRALAALRTGDRARAERARAAVAARHDAARVLPLHAALAAATARRA